MQHIFINSLAILRPDYFTKYYTTAGESYLRVESAIDNTSFQKDSDAVRIELYRNCAGNKVMPVLVEVIHRQEMD